ncbi:MAG: exonuclease III, partial [Paracoccaceae bacterium]
DPQGGVPDHSNPHDAPRFDSSFQIDLGVDGNHEKVNFSKPPLEVELHPIGAKPIRLIGVHVKSKAPHGAKSPNEVAQISTANRRKQLAQSIWLRRRIDAHVTAGDAIVVAGDLNDGPGLDEYEQILGRSSVEVVMGVGGDKARQLFDPHAIAAMKPQIDNPPATSRFYIKPKRAYLNALLDYIMVSPDLHARAKGWEIWHPFDNAACFKDRALHKALLTASDHFPVSLDLNL